MDPVKRNEIAWTVLRYYLLAEGSFRLSADMREKVPELAKDMHLDEKDFRDFGEVLAQELARQVFQK